MGGRRTVPVEPGGGVGLHEKIANHHLAVGVEVGTFEDQAVGNARGIGVEYDWIILD